MAEKRKFSPRSFLQIFITINGCLLVLHQIQMLTHPLDQHFKRNGVLSALRDDHVGTALARLYELLVHRFYLSLIHI